MRLRADMASLPHPELVRAIGRWTLAALVLNSIIGSGIFGLPDDIYRRLGPASPFAYLIAAGGVGIIMACFAEVASQFSTAGGPYLYAREAFGQLAGIQMGWLAWLVRLTSAAANANLFVTYLGEFVAPLRPPPDWALLPNLWWPRGVTLTLLLGLLAYVNVRGVKGGAQLSNVFTIAKLLPMLFFIATGFYFVGSRIQVGATAAPKGDWLEAVLALVFAYGGFEAALMPMGEAKNPRRDAPFALFTALAGVTLVYTLIHLVVMGAIPDPASYETNVVQERPIAEAARAFLGAGGAWLIAIGVMISTYGYLAGQFVSAPRLTFAFAEQRDFPEWFGRVHAEYRTPFVSILVYAAITLGLALYGSFYWNAILSAVARLFTYAFVCGALPMLRWKRPQADAFRLPLGWLFALLGIGFCAVLVFRMTAGHLVIVGVVAGVAFLNWLLARRRSSPVNVAGRQ
jgi:amino acid transporter